MLYGGEVERWVSVGQSQKWLAGKEVRALHVRTLEMEVRLGRVLQKLTGRRWYPRGGRVGLLLLRLGQWEERYRVPLEFVVRTLREYWEVRTRKRRKRKAGPLCCPVWVFVGPRSERVLSDAILEAFPGAENVDQWRWERRRELLGLTERGRVRSVRADALRSPRKFVRQYELQIRRRQLRLDKALASEARKRRVYRGNPWL